MIYRLLKSKTAKRILFLVDRRALATQGIKEFAAFEPEPAQKLDKLYEVYSQRFRTEDLAEDRRFDPRVLPNEYLTNPKSNHTFVYVCTIQRMRINLFGRQGMFPWTEEDEYEDDVDKLDNIPVHAFDFVIADECHRGYTAGEESKCYKNRINCNSCEGKRFSILIPILAKSDMTHLKMKGNSTPVRLKEKPLHLTLID